MKRRADTDDLSTHPVCRASPRILQVAYRNLLHTEHNDRERKPLATQVIGLEQTDATRPERLELPVLGGSERGKLP
jgi:hypothetical protein